MVLFLTRLPAIYRYLNDEISDPRALNYPLMKNPLLMLLILIFYLYFVLEWGPKMMEKRKPFNLERILIVFNVAQIALSSYMFISGMMTLIEMKHNWVCEPVDYSSTPNPLHLVKLTYMYFITKVLDLLDTVFFILRKKQNQVTFLHVYHHGGMLVCTWMGVKYLPGGHGSSLGVLNTLVHTAMYTYYFLTSLSPKYKNNLWWKKYITQLQLIQFFILTIHFSILFFIDCGFPQFVAYFIVPQNIFMLTMFGDFYIKTYIRPKRRNTPQKELNGMTPLLDALTVTLDRGEIIGDHGKSE